MKRSRHESISNKGCQEKERRQFPRTKENLELTYVVVSGKDRAVVSKNCRARVEDLSTGGLSFKTNEIVVDGLHISSETTPKGPIRNRLDLQFQLPGLSNKIKASCKVIWYELVERLSMPIYSVGVQFLGLQPEYKEAIKMHVDNIMGERRPLRI